MNPGIRTAGICGSVVFIITALPGFYRQSGLSNWDLMGSASFSGFELLISMGFSLLGALVAGVIGYFIGNIWNNPQGNKRRRRKTKPVKTKRASESIAGPSGESDGSSEETENPEVSE
ncbi:MAG: hypothetical protein AAGI66_00635 [Cyanobacteria bacterium P01_H01_bin.74]